MSCIDDPDISIRLQALDLGAGMVNSDNITSVVGRLLRQLRNSPVASAGQEPPLDRGHAVLEPSADSDGEDPEEMLKPADKVTSSHPTLPEEYRVNVIRRILDMCSHDKYTNIVDFDWYIDVLTELAKLVPASSQRSTLNAVSSPIDQVEVSSSDTAVLLGSELRNVAVRVKSIRREATRAADSLLKATRRGVAAPWTRNVAHGVLPSAAWVVGEYADYLDNLDDTIDAFLNPSNLSFPAAVLSAYLQAIPKIFSTMMKRQDWNWDPERKARASLLLARMLHSLDPLSTHPSLEVQQRAIELLELLRLAAEAISGQEESCQGPPLLPSLVIPSLFSGSELNPVAPGAQKKVPLPENIDLDAPLHHDLVGLLRHSEMGVTEIPDYEDDFELFYKQSQIRQHEIAPSNDNDLVRDPESASMQHATELPVEDTGIIARKRAERRERYKDDPFYIANEDSSGTSTPFHNILKDSNGEDVDIDAIPIMDLNLGEENGPNGSAKGDEPAQKPRKRPKRVDIAADENIDIDERDSIRVAGTAIATSVEGAVQTQREIVKKSLLQVDSSGLRDFALEATTEDWTGGPQQLERREDQDSEMAKALREVERLRLEMQRASERVHVGEDIPPEGTLVKKRTKKKKKKTMEGEAESLCASEEVTFNRMLTTDSLAQDEGKVSARPKKKKKKKGKEQPVLAN